MGSILSQIRLTAETLLAIAAAYRRLSKRIAASPGIPIPNPSTPYWTIPASDIAKHNHDEFPEYADVVVIGSGIAGTSFTRTLLDEYYADKQFGNRDGKEPLKVVMLDARDACYGATGRNGGHVSPILYPEYPTLKKKLGVEEAKTIIRFRRAHIEEYLKVSKEEGLDVDSQIRRVQTYDVFFDKGLLDEMKERLAVYLEEIPEEKDKWTVLEDRKLLQDLQFHDGVVGVISTTAGAIHPYRLVTGTLERLLSAYHESFYLFTNTPCLSIDLASSGTDYTVTTPRGSIRAPHVVHATNAWASHLIKPMRRKIFPLRGVMTAQRPGTNLGKPPTDHTFNQNGESESWRGQRSFVFYPGPSGNFDYLTQMPAPSSSSSNEPPSSSSSSKYPTPSAELMFGGGFSHGGLLDSNLASIGNVDDSTWDVGLEAYLSGALASGSNGGYFGRHWGREGRPEDNGSFWVDLMRNEELGEGRVIKAWSGIIGISADRLPWVGRLSEKIAGRKEPKVSSVTRSTERRTWTAPRSRTRAAVLEEEDTDETTLAEDCSSQCEKFFSEHPSNSSLAAPGEWIVAGFTGEGMTHAWLSGKALAYMMLNKEYSEQFFLPDSFRVTEKRWKKARPEM
ncbi:FAD dependent oxidoreductase [Dendrothele bispora CBS 962.96]|uniref:FAD dependent oxidoreductase n=1 Tax=Dendrothele bispora (strain CBS 962.96) TaxID=1314807 RepID=A0A4S8MFN1_DENBC|nr:FAD dependent oxidoreductase [Dendrothele bispora CBS 962.96]